VVWSDPGKLRVTMSDEREDYTDVTIKAAPMPSPLRVGRWWRRRWNFDLIGEAGGSFCLPPPAGELENLALIASCWWESSSRFVFELLTLDERLSADELVYLSLVGAWLKLEYPDASIMVEGDAHHPMLKASEIPADVAASWRANGYGRVRQPGSPSGD
jgi:hypothetical protein